MNLETRPRGRTRNRWHDEVREDGRMVGGEEWQENVYVYNVGTEETPENGKESSHSAHANGMNECGIMFGSTPPHLCQACFQFIPVYFLSSPSRLTTGHI
jgi:hypothetical protein